MRGGGGGGEGERERKATEDFTGKGVERRGEVRILVDPDKVDGGSFDKERQLRRRWFQPLIVGEI